MIASRSSCRFVVCTSMMWISRSTASQRCSIGLRSGDCGGYLSKVNSLSCSRNQSEMIWALWHGALSCWKYIRRWYTVVIKGWTWSATILRKTVVFKRCTIGTKGLKVCQENISHTITPAPAAWTNETQQDRSMLSCSLHQILTLPSECRSRNRDSSDQATFSNLLLSSFGEPVWIVFSVCCSYLTEAAPGVVFCCWSPSASGFDVLCIRRWYSAYLGCNEWLFELLLPFYHL